MASGGFLQSILANYDPSRPPAAAVAPAASAPTAASAVTTGSDLSPTSSGVNIAGPGGLASSPNVPAPGSSIDPATGQPHTAGITRAELEARKAAAVGGAQTSGLMGGLGTSPNVPLPGTSINPATGQPHTAGLTRAELDAMKAKGNAIPREAVIQANFAQPDMSGREQAAAQLAGTGLVVPSSPTARRSSIVDVSGSHVSVKVDANDQDLEKNVREISHKVYEAVPAGVKDIFAEPKGKGVEGSPVKPRRGSAAGKSCPYLHTSFPANSQALFENVRVQATNLAHTVKEAVVYDPETSRTLPPATSTAPPSGLKDAHVPPITAQTHSTLAEPSSPNTRRASVLDTVALQAKRLGQDVQTTLSSAGKWSFH